MHRLVEVILSATIHACIANLRYFFTAWTSSLLSFNRLVSACLFLERYHLVDVWLLGLLDVVELLPDHVLSVLALQNQAVQDLHRKVRLSCIALVCPHPL